jgi:hypothetical protein
MVICYKYIQYISYIFVSVIYTVEFYSAIKRNEIRSFVRKRMELEFDYIFDYT